MRIAFLTPEYVTESNFDGGLANYLHRVAVDLHNSGHDVEIFTSSDQDAEIRHDGILVHKVNHKIFLCNLMKILLRHTVDITIDIVLRSYFLKKRFLAEHAKNKFDIIQSSSFWAPGLLIAMSKQVNVVTRISSFEPLWRAACKIPCALDNALAEWLELVQMRHSKSVYAPSRLLAETVQRFEPLTIDVIYPPLTVSKVVLDDSFYNSELNGINYLLFFGSICRLKGIELIWDNLSKILSENRDIHFVFIGKGQLPPLYHELLPHKNRIHTFGAMQHSKLFPVIMGAKAVVLPSIIDNLPNACLESMLLGKVVVGTRGASFEELIEDGVSGYLVNYHDENQFISIISKISQSSEEDLRKIGEKARFSVMEQFDSAERFKDLECYYKNVMAKE